MLNSKEMRVRILIYLVLIIAFTIIVKWVTTINFAGEPIFSINANEVDHIHLSKYDEDIILNESDRSKTIHYLNEMRQTFKKSINSDGRPPYRMRIYYKNGEEIYFFFGAAYLDLNDLRYYLNGDGITDIMKLADKLCAAETNN